MGAFSERGDHVIPVSGKVFDLACGHLFFLFRSSHLGSYVEESIHRFFCWVSRFLSKSSNPYLLLNQSPGLYTVFAGPHSSSTVRDHWDHPTRSLAPEYIRSAFQLCSTKDGVENQLNFSFTPTNCRPQPSSRTIRLICHQVHHRRM
jgi:hypothetical protein